MVLLKRRAATEQTEAERSVEEASPGLEQLSRELNSADSSVRRLAARLLAAMPEATALLCAHLQSDPSVGVRSIVFTELSAHPSAAAVEGLLPFLRSEDVGLRNGAIEALQRMPGAVMPFMEQVLADTDSDVRIMAVNVLGMLHHPATPARLLRVVAEDPHVNVCAAALDALAEVGEPEAIPALEDLARRFCDVAFIQFAVEMAIRRIRGGGGSRPANPRWLT